MNLSTHTPLTTNDEPIHIPPQLFENQLLKYEQAAQFLGICESYLRKLKRRGEIKYVAIGDRGVRFRVITLKQWIEKREIA